MLGCGGTIARLASEGRSIHIVLLADGEGSRHNDPDKARSFHEQKATRRAAAQRASAILGAQSVDFGEFPDNRMDSVDLLDIVKSVEELVDRYQPEMVLSHHSGDVNIDHRRVYEAVIAACRPQPGHPVRTMLFFEIPSSTEWQIAGLAPPFLPNWFVDISAQLTQKRCALESYATEMRPWPHSRSYEAVEHLARWRGATSGFDAAEAFVTGRVLLPG